MFDYDIGGGTIWIYDEITADGYGGVSSGDVVNALRKIGDNPVSVKINSPGGSVFEGIAIYNALRDHKAPVTTSNDALAASIASIIFLAGDERLSAPNSFYMMHEPYSPALGTAAELRSQADLLDTAGDTLTNIYVEQTNYNVESVRSMMALETWFTADEQIESGIASGTTRQVSIEAAPVAKTRFRNTPSALVKDLAAGSRTPHLLKLAELQNRLKLLKSKNR